MKKLIPLLAIVAIVFAFVPDAQASHCVRCRYFVDYSVCNFGVNFGQYECDYDLNGVCYTFGGSCRDFAAAAPLSSEFMVASVERIDEPAKPADTLVAQAAAPQPQSIQR